MVVFTVLLRYCFIYYVGLFVLSDQSQTRESSEATPISLYSPILFCVLCIVNGLLQYCLSSLSYVSHTMSLICLSCVCHVSLTCLSCVCHVSPTCLSCVCHVSVMCLSFVSLMSSCLWVWGAVNGGRVPLPYLHGERPGLILPWVPPGGRV